LTRNPSNGSRSFLENFGGTFLVVTHDRYFLDRVTSTILELSDGKFFSHAGNYTDTCWTRPAPVRRRDHRAQAPDVF